MNGLFEHVDYSVDVRKSLHSLNIEWTNLKAVAVNGAFSCDQNRAEIFNTIIVLYGCLCKTLGCLSLVNRYKTAWQCWQPCGRVGRVLL